MRDDPLKDQTITHRRRYCNEGLPSFKLEHEGEESWEGSAKKVAEGSDASRKYVARVGLKLEVALVVGV